MNKMKIYALGAILTVSVATMPVIAVASCGGKLSYGDKQFRELQNKLNILNKSKLDISKKINSKISELDSVIKRQRTLKKQKELLLKSESEKTSKLEKINKELFLVKKQFSILEDNRTQLTDELKKKHDEIIKLKAKIKILDGKLYQRTNELKLANDKVVSIENDINKFVDDLKKANDNVSKLTSNISKANARVAKLTVDISKTNDKVDLLKNDNAILADELKKEHHKVVKLTADLKLANDKVVKLTADLKNAKSSSNISKLTADLKKANDKVSKLTNDIQIANNKVVSLETDKTKLVDDLKKEHDKVVKLTADLKIPNDKIIKLTADLKIANDKVTSLEADKTKLTDDLKKANDKSIKLTSDISKTNDKLLKLTSDLSLANIKITSLEADKTKLVDDLKKANDKTTTLENEKTKLTNDLKKANDQVIKSTADLKIINDKAASLKADKDKLEKDLNDLKIELNRVKKELGDAKELLKLYRDTPLNQEIILTGINGQGTIDESVLKIDTTKFTLTPITNAKNGINTLVANLKNGVTLPSGKNKIYIKVMVSGLKDTYYYTVQGSTTHYKNKADALLAAKALLEKDRKYFTIDGKRYTKESVAVAHKFQNGNLIPIGIGAINGLNKAFKSGTGAKDGKTYVVSHKINIENKETIKLKDNPHQLPTKGIFLKEAGKWHGNDKVEITKTLTGKEWLKLNITGIKIDWHAFFSRAAVANIEWSDFCFVDSNNVKYPLYKSNLVIWKSGPHDPARFKKFEKELLEKFYKIASENPNENFTLHGYTQNKIGSYSQSTTTTYMMSEAKSLTKFYDDIKIENGSIDTKQFDVYSLKKEVKIFTSDGKERIIVGDEIIPVNNLTSIEVKYTKTISLPTADNRIYISPDFEKVIQKPIIYKITHPFVDQQGNEATDPKTILGLNKVDIIATGDGTGKTWDNDLILALHDFLEFAKTNKNYPWINRSSALFEYIPNIAVYLTDKEINDKLESMINKVKTNVI